MRISAKLLAFKITFQRHMCVYLGLCCVFLYQELLINTYINISCKKINHHPSPALQMVLEKLVRSPLKYASACRRQSSLVDFCRLRCVCWTWQVLFRPEFRVKLFDWRQTLFSFECELSPAGSVWPLSLQLVALFWEVVEPSGGGASQGWGLEAWFPGSIPFLVCSLRPDCDKSHKSPQVPVVLRYPREELDPLLNCNIP